MQSILSHVRVALFSAVFALLALATEHSSNAQDTTEASIVITLEEAIQIALVENQSLSMARLDYQTARSQIREGWGELFPLIEANSSFTRNVRSANPFAGSQAGGLFETLGFMDWLSFNEMARTDADPETEPIPIGEYFMRQQEGLQEAGVVLDSGDNPFSVPNQYSAAISVTQKLFDGRAFFGARGASRWLGPMNLAAISRQEQLLVDEVKRGWYTALLAIERSQVLSQSVERSRRTLQEVARQVTQGTAPKFQRLSAEVELANLETELVQAENGAAAALDNLKLSLGIHPGTDIQLRGSLQEDSRMNLDALPLEDATSIALSQRPDLEEVRIGLELENVQLKVAKSAYLPTLDAFANLGYIGNVPDNRTSYSSVDGDPFSFTTTEFGYFSEAYWDWNFNVGFRLSWTLFDGLATRERVQQRRIALDRAQIGLEQIQNLVRVEVERALRDLSAAQVRMGSQQQNVERAELNFTYAETRLQEGVASPIEVREASNQLDQARLNYLQAVHDYLLAHSAWLTSLGESPDDSTDTRRN